VLLCIEDKAIAEQRLILDENIDKIDDVCGIGIKV